MNAPERVLDLLAFLLAHRSPVPIADIYEAFEDEYAGTPEARDRKFSRDKDQLRRIGVPIVHHAADADGEGGGYVVDRSAFFLSDVALTPEERAALFAIGAAAMASALPLQSELAHALTKLRTISPDGHESAPPIIRAEGARRSEVEERVTTAIANRRRLVITYPPERRKRQVDPYVFSIRRNRFSFVGYCHLRKAIRTFHADRVATCELAGAPDGPSEFDIPAGFDPRPHLPAHPWQIRLHAPMDVELAFPAALAESGPRALGLGPGEPCRTTNLEGLVSEVLALGEGIRIVGPTEARDAMRARLRSMRQALGDVP